MCQKRNTKNCFVSSIILNIRIQRNIWKSVSMGREKYLVESNGVLHIVLRSLSHRSILPVKGVYRGRRRGSVYLITDLYDTTLDEILHFQIPLKEVLFLAL